MQSNRNISSREERYFKLSRRARNGQEDTYSMQSLPSRKRSRPRGQRKYKSVNHRPVETEPTLLPSRTTQLDESSRVGARELHGSTREEQLRSSVHHPAMHPGLVTNSATTLQQDKSVSEQAEQIAKLSLENKQLNKHRRTWKG